MVNVKARDVKLFRVATRRRSERCLSLLLFDGNAANGANAGAFVAADAVFSVEVEAIMTVFGEGEGIMGIRQGDASRPCQRAATDRSGPSAPCRQEVS